MIWIRLGLMLLRELLLSALKVSWIVLQPKPRLRPAFIAYPLTVTGDVQITLLANLITLTPGTLSVDVSDDRRTLLIHVLDAGSREAVIGEIAGGFETLVLEATR